MPDVRQALERGVEGVAPPAEWFERMLRRRDRKRRRQRITAAAVGIAFALIAVLVGTRVWPSASVPVQPSPSVSTPVLPPPAGNADITLVRKGVISVVRPDGSGLHRLVVIPRKEPVRYAAWSPDGSHLAISVENLGGPRIHGSVFVMNADGTGIHELPGCNCAEFAWSPDGARLALVDAGKGGDLARLSHGWLDTYGVDGGLEHRSPIPIWFSSPSWSADGARIVFSELHSSTDELYVVGADGSGLHRLGTVPTSPDGVVDWSPDRSGVAFETYDQRRNVEEAYVADPIGSEPRLVQRSGCAEAPCGAPLWSPDGTRLVFSDSVGVWTVDAHGGHRTLVYRWPKGARLAAEPHWSPDGSYVVVTEHEGSDGRNRVVVMGPDGSGVTPVAGGGSVIAP